MLSILLTSCAPGPGLPHRVDEAILGSPPDLLGVSVLPSAPRTTDRLACVPHRALGSNVEIHTVWLVDGVAVSADPILAGAFHVGQTVACTATPHHGRSMGPTRRSGSVTVVNSPPLPPEVSIEPADPTLGLHDLVCRIPQGRDPDGDATSTTVLWYADGVSWRGRTATTERFGDTIEAFDTPRARTWSCVAHATDPAQATTSATATVRPRIASTNVLVLLADDLSLDKVGAYGVHPDPPPTPRIDQLAAEGVKFHNFYTSPTCSPGRATLLTGRRSRRYGIGTPIRAEEDVMALPPAEVLVPEMLDHAPAPYTSVLTGKWHLSSYLTGPGPLHPGLEGFDWYAGSVENLHRSPGVDLPTNYFRWEKNTNGSLSETHTYATRDTVDDAVAAIGQLPEPWLLWVAFNAPHWPFHVPDEPRLTQVVDEESSTIDQANAMVESLDFAVGDILDSMDPDLLDRTTVFFLGDNGTDPQAIAPPWNPAGGKGTLHEAGVNAPLIVTGPLVAHAGADSDALVSSTDLFDTIAAIAGVDVVEADRIEGVAVRDGVSLLPYLADPDRQSRRGIVYTDKHLPNGPPPYDIYDRAVFDGRYKLHRIGRGSLHHHELYDLADGPIEGEDLLQGSLTVAQGQALAALRAELDRIEADLVYEY